MPRVGSDIFSGRILNLNSEIKVRHMRKKSQYSEIKVIILRKSSSD